MVSGTVSVGIAATRDLPPNVFYGMLATIGVQMVVAAAMLVRLPGFSRRTPRTVPSPIAVSVDTVADAGLSAGIVAEIEALRTNGTRFGDAMNERLSDLSVSTDALRSIADEVSRAALRIMTESVSISVAADDTNGKVADMLSVGTDFVRTIASVADHAATSARAGGDAVAQMEAASTIIDDLNIVSDQIGAMTSLVAGIAGQTNLLALNATIEAARAGEQGRGFAVVASEVKSLATQTSQAVSTIADMVQKIRGTAKNSVAALTSVTLTIRALNQSTADIALSVGSRVQAASTMMDTTTKAASNVRFLTNAVRTIESVANETMQSADALSQTADDLAVRTIGLRDGIDQFIAATDDAVESSSDGRPAKTADRASSCFSSSSVLQKELA